MKNLFIDTASSRVIIAVTEKDSIISMCNEGNDHELSSRIFPIIDKVLKESHITPQELDCIYVVTGPGSFTGVRIGVTIAKTMAWSLKKTLIPISELELMATTTFDGDYIIPFIDARRNAFFAAIYDREGKAILQDQYIKNEDLLKKIPKDKKIVFVGYDHVSNFSSIIPEVEILKIINRHQNDIVKNPHEINPEYLKRTEAEENLEKGNL